MDFTVVIALKLAFQLQKIVITNNDTMPDVFEILQGTWCYSKDFICITCVFFNSHCNPVVSAIIFSLTDKETETQRHVTSLALAHRLVSDGARL